MKSKMSKTLTCHVPLPGVFAMTPGTGRIGGSRHGRRFRDLDIDVEELIDASHRALACTLSGAAGP